ncbi:hypothetical protein AN191_08725 [Loktanella sp. 5RATIMAR09]|uniref:NYN domain-containing protein n=1 Tax=Loktanella sp. 5RATIMAR09 TaxID=1225655 RepID=UPI0006EB37CB|nr:hypothetical protein [Loktanella sp. 5RATIMAR09]KQI72206.1 hypothetical protein AN191_08725 [Loktanella sp. 5RATIMAR09]
MQDLDLVELISIAALLLVLFLRFRPKRRRPERARAHKAPVIPPPAEIPVPGNAILVDGSNVMHWGPEPSFKILAQVLRSLERAGYTPVVFFDASVGYVLDDHYYDEAKLAPLLAVPQEHICVVNKGVIADVSILSMATDHGLRVVSNDKYRDWRVKFPHAAKKGVLLDGTWREGTVVWRGKLNAQVVHA